MIAAVYAMVSIVWITISDIAVDAIGYPKASQLQTIKGASFVLLTATLLYLLVRRLVRQLQEAERRRTSSERLFRTLIETAGEGVCLTDSHDRITFVNPQLASMLGFEADELFGTPIADIVSQHDLSRVRENLGGSRRRGSGQFDVRLIGKRSERWTLISAAPNFDPEGHYLGAFLMVLDISERKRLEEELRHSQTLDAVGRFAGGIAHDFNNLLGVILGYASLLQGSLPSKEEIHRSAEQITDASNRAATLIRQLLAFSRKQAVTSELIDVNSAVRNLAQVLPRIMGEDIELVVSSADEPAMIRIGTGQIEQIVLNLSANARDAMPSGGRLELASYSADGQNLGEVGKSCSGPSVKMRISDSGTGISPEIKSRIFEPFFTTKPVGRGTGLGLSTVYGVVHQNGGQIEVDSTPGKGTTFTISFPEADIPKTEQSLPEISIATEVRGTGTILLVEDEAALRALTRLILESNGYEVLEAANAAEALRTSRSYPDDIHLLLTDMVMPGASGAELAIQLRSERASLKIAIMSGYVEPVELAKIPGTCVIEKPVIPSALLLRLRSIMQGQAQVPAS
jgi:two-component system, cell cycle sensor histidine kinase and response regulator CckA